MARDYLGELLLYDFDDPLVVKLSQTFDEFGILWGEVIGFAWVLFEISQKDFFLGDGFSVVRRSGAVDDEFPLVFSDSPLLFLLPVQDIMWRSGLARCDDRCDILTVDFMVGKFDAAVVGDGGQPIGADRDLFPDLVLGDLSRPGDDAGYANASFPEGELMAAVRTRAAAAGVRPDFDRMAMIAEKDDDGFFPQAELVNFVDDLADLFVEG